MMTSADRRRLRAPTPRVALLIAAVAVAAVVLYLGREALTPFILGLVVIYVLDPAVEWLSRGRLPRWLAVLVVYAVALGVVVEGLNLILAPFVEQVQGFARDLPRFTSALQDQLQQLSQTYRGLNLPPEIRSIVDEAIAGASRQASGVNVGVLLPIATSIASTLSSIFGYLLIPVWAFYILKDRPKLTTYFDRALPEEWRTDTWAVLHIVDRVFGRWLKGQLWLGLTVGVATFAGLLVMGSVVDPIFARFALLLAILAGLLELLPIIGPILAAVPTGLIALTVSPQAVLAVIVLYTVVQQVENNVLVPKIQGDAVELHPAIVMFALVVGATIAGLLGAILALPLTAAGRDVFRYLFRRLSEPAEPPAQAAAQAAQATVAPAAELRPPPAEGDGAEGVPVRVVQVESGHPEHNALPVDAVETGDLGISPIVRTSREPHA